MGIRYKDWSEPALNTRVLYMRDSTSFFPLNGKTGHVVSGARKSKRGNQVRNLVSVQFDDGRVIGCYVSNLERINEVASTRNLVGPKPKPLEEPEHPTPWSYSGNLILDANRNKVMRVGKGDPYGTLSPTKATLLASAIVEAMNEKYKEEDAPAPW